MTDKLNAAAGVYFGMALCVLFWMVVYWLV